MRFLIILATLACLAFAQPPGGRGRAGGGIQTMTLITTAWPDGGAIPLDSSRYVS